MFMIFPYRVVVGPKRPPYANYLLMMVLVAGHIWQQFYPMIMTCPYILKGGNPFGIFGHIWFHGGLLHLLGNMYYMWLFGNAVCSQLKGPLYVLVYIVGGMFAGLVHLYFDATPAVGASGAISVVLGFYLVLFTFHDLDCVMIFFLYIRRISIAGMWLLLLWFFRDILHYALGLEGIAYLAHIAGFLFGVVVCIALLAAGWIKRDNDEAIILEACTYER